MYRYQTAFDLDLTGRSPDNLVKLEPHTLNKKINRVIAPDNGLFYGSTVIIRDGAYTLLENVDYLCVEMNQDLTEQTGLGVYCAIVIFNQNISANVTITYQVVGGPYTFDNKAIANLYESVLNDSRLIHWNNVSNKPSEFPPGDHFHPLRDLIGWQPIIHQMERLIMVIGLSSVDITKKIVNALLGTFNCGELEKNLPTTRLVQYDAMLHTLSERKLLSQCSVRTDLCKWYPGRMAHFDIDTSGYPEGHKFYWTFYKEHGEKINIPIDRSGIVTGNGKTIRVYSYVPGSHIDENEVLYVGVNVKPFSGDFDAVTYQIVFAKPIFGYSNYGQLTSLKFEESDFTSIPSLFNKGGTNAIEYLMGHFSPVEFKTL